MSNVGLHHIDIINKRVNEATSPKMAEGSSKFRCFVCQLVSVSVSQLHYHQMFGHSLEELSISVISLQGLLNIRELDPGRTICDEMLLESLLKYPQLLVCPVKPENFSIDNFSSEDLFSKCQTKVKRAENIYLKEEERLTDASTSTGTGSSKIGALRENQPCCRRRGLSPKGDQVPLKWDEGLEGCAEISHESFLESVHSFCTELSGIKETMADRTFSKQEKIIDKLESSDESLCVWENEFNGMKEISHESFLESVRGICNDLSGIKERAWRGKWPGKKSNAQKKGGQKMTIRLKDRARLAKNVPLNCRNSTDKKWKGGGCETFAMKHIENLRDDSVPKKETGESYAKNGNFLIQSSCMKIPMEKGEIELYPKFRENWNERRISSSLGEQSVQYDGNVKLEMESQEIPLQKRIFQDDFSHPEMLPKFKTERKKKDIFAVNGVENYNDAFAQVMVSREETLESYAENSNLLKQIIRSNIPLQENEMKFYPENRQNLNEGRISNSLSKIFDKNSVTVKQEVESQEIPSQEAILQDDSSYIGINSQDKTKRERNEHFLINGVENYNDSCKKLMVSREETVESYETDENLLKQNTHTNIPLQKKNVNQEMESQENPLQEAILQDDSSYIDIYSQDKTEREKNENVLINGVENYNDSCKRLVVSREETVEIYETDENLLKQNTHTNIPLQKKNVNQEMEIQEIPLQEAILQDDSSYIDIYSQDKTEREKNENVLINGVENYNDSCKRLVVSREETVEIYETDENLLKQNTHTNIPLQKKNVNQEMEIQEIPLQEAILQDDSSYIDIYSQDKTEREKNENVLINGVENYNDSCKRLVVSREETVEIYETDENLLKQNTHTNIPLQKKNVNQEMDIQEIPSQEAVLQNDSSYIDIYSQDKTEKGRNEHFLINEVENYNDFCKRLVVSREETVESYDENYDFPQQGIQRNTPIKEEELKCYPENKQRIAEYRISNNISKQSDQDDVNVEQRMESQEIPLQEVILQDHIWLQESTCLSNSSIDNSTRISSSSNTINSLGMLSKQNDICTLTGILNNNTEITNKNVNFV